MGVGCRVGVVVCLLLGAITCSSHRLSLWWAGSGGGSGVVDFPHFENCTVDASIL